MNNIKILVTVLLVFAGLYDTYGQNGTISGNTTPQLNAVESYSYSAWGWFPISGSGVLSATKNECNIAELNGDGTYDLLSQWTVVGGEFISCNASSATVKWDEGGTGTLTYFQDNGTFWIGNLGVTVIECEFADPDISVTEIESGLIDIYTDLDFSIIPIDENGCLAGTALAPLTVAGRGEFAPVVGSDRQYEISCEDQGSGTGDTSLRSRSAGNNAIKTSYNIPAGTYGVEWECDGESVYWIVNVTQCTQGNNPAAGFSLTNNEGNCVGQEATYTSNIPSNKWSQYVFEWTISETGQNDVIIGGSTATSVGTIDVARSSNSKTISLTVSTRDADPCTGDVLSGTSADVTLSAGTAYTTLSNGLSTDLSNLPAGCAGSTVTITAEEGHSGASFNWGGEGLVSSTGSSAVVTRGMSVTLEVTSTDACVNGSGEETYDIPEGTAYTTLSNGLSTDLSNLPAGCAGSTVTITAEEDHSGASFNWGGEGLVSATGSSAVVTRGMSVTLEVTSTDACVNGSGEETHDIPEGTAYTTLSNGLSTDLSNLPAGCAGSTITITAEEGHSGASFNWGGAGLVSSDGSSAVVTRGMAVTLEVTSTDACVNGSGEETYNIPQGTAYTTLSNGLSTDLSNLPAGCAGSTVTITAEEGHSGASFNWGGEGLVSSTGSSAVVTRGMSVTLEVTSTDACVNGSGVETYDVPEGAPILTTSVSITTDASETVCKGTGVTFTANAVNFTSPSYLWSTGATTSSIFETINSDQTITVTVTEGDGSACVSSTSEPGSYQISVYDPPAISASDYHYCSEDPSNNPIDGVTSMTISGIQSGFTYYIEAPDRIDASASGEFVGVFSAATYDVYAHAPGCTPEVVGSINVTKTDPPAEVIDVENGTALDACFNAAELHAPEGGTDYQWYRDEVALEDEVNDFYDLTALDIGTHTYKVTYEIVEGTCTFSQEAELEVVVIEPDRPGINVAVENGETRVCADETITFSGELQNISGGTYTWWKVINDVESVIQTGDVAISGEGTSVPDVTVLIEEDTEIKLTISNIDGCVTSTEISYSMFMEVKNIVQRVNQVLRYCKYTSGLDLILDGDDLDTEYALYVESPVGSGSYSFVSLSAPRTADNPELRFGMQVEGSYQLTGVNTACGIAETVLLTFTIEESVTPCLNYTTTQLHDETGLFGESRAFFDLTGDEIQNNVRNLSEGYSLVDQTKYDALDRPGLQTLPAPVVDPGLDYFPEFVEVDELISTQRAFTPEKWDKDDPTPVSTDEGNPLGWYYSESNAELEPGTDISQHPYARTFYFNDGTEEVRSSSAAGDPFVDNEDRRTYTKGFPVNTELNGDYKAIRELLFNYNSPSLAGKVVKTVSRDANGLEGVTFTDSDGNVLATALGNLTDANAVQWITSFNDNGDEYEVLDFHVPQDGTALTLSSLPGSVTKLIDLKNDEEVTDFTSVDKGFYRLTNGTLSYTLKYFNPSFNFYDDQNRLILAIPPNGVKAILEGFDYTNAIDDIPFATYYEYDYQGRLISMREPDHNIEDDPLTTDVDESLISSETIYIYRKDGSIKFSQNALQRIQNPKTFSYTNYDVQGRPIESGEYAGIMDEDYPNGLDLSIDEQATVLDPYLENTSANGGFLDTWPHDRNDWVKTYYDLPDANTGNDFGLPRDIEISAYNPRHNDLKVLGRLEIRPGFSIDAAEGTFTAHAISESDLPEIDLPFEQDFVYGSVSYTENENVKTWYNYDEQGQVTEMATWFKEMDEAKSIRYEYDFAGNVTYVAYQEDYTRSDGTAVDHDDSFFHRYFYNSDNRLSKVYAARVAISATTPDALDLQATYDYYIHGPLKRMELGGNLQGVDYVYNLNGQLKAINDPENKVDQSGFEEDAFAQAYHYYAGDYLRSGAFSGDNPTHATYNGNIAGISWNLVKNGSDQPGQYQYNYDGRYFLKSATFDQTNAFKVNNLTYDPNGNILTLLRNDGNGTVQPGFDGGTGQYQYNTGTNQLQSVNNYGSYDYNAIGQMIRQERLDGSAEVLKPVYDVMGKVLKILDQNGELRTTYEYDDRGFRIRSIDHTSNDQETYYVRDAAGQLLAIYEKDGDSYALKENPIYGQGRIGSYFPINSITQYELKDHLGNVRALINKQNRDADYVASYYPFGSIMKPVDETGNIITNGVPGRFGYQGDFSEYDEETQLNYFEARFYDAKIGRWLTIDPARQFASPFNGMGNNPVNGVDPDGRFYEWKIYQKENGEYSYRKIGELGGEDVQYIHSLDDPNQVVVVAGQLEGGIPVESLNWPDIAEHDRDDFNDRMIDRINNGFTIDPPVNERLDCVSCFKKYFGQYKNGTYFVITKWTDNIGREHVLFDGKSALVDGITPTNTVSSVIIGRVIWGSLNPSSTVLGFYPMNIGRLITQHNFYYHGRTIEPKTTK